MEVFKPIKVENYQFMKNGLNQYGYEVAILRKVLEISIQKMIQNFKLKKQEIRERQEERDLIEKEIIIEFQ